MLAGSSRSVSAAALLLAGCGSAGQSSEADPEVSGGQEPGITETETAPETETASVDISGRWGMFHFEDPVAIEVTQNGSQLSGLGCDAGLPMADDDRGWSDSCGPLTGHVEGNHARFVFDSLGVSFEADVTVSTDSMRMAGDFTDVVGVHFKSAWLRLRSDERSLGGRASASPEPLQGSYALTVSPASADSSFDPLQTYEVTYAPARGIYGDLGAFYYTELTRGEDDTAPLIGGPVAATDPTLPVSLEIEHGASTFTRVTVVDASGIVTVFDATRREF